MKKYRIAPPVGNIIAKNEMTEKELRDFCSSLIMDTDATAETWKEKVQKDEIVDVVEWLQMQGYGVNEI